MFNPPRHRVEKVESTIPSWVVYALLGTVAFIIATSIHSAILTLFVSGTVILFIWSYLSKPVADIQPQKEESLFEKNIIDKKTWQNPSEPHAQRKRYLKSIDDEPSKAA